MNSQTITPRQIEAFKAIMDTGLVTAAAERMHVSQPAVSKLLASLEHAIGLTLFVRVKKRLQPTAEATLLYREVDKVFVGLQHVAGLAREIKGLRSGEISIASLSTLGHQHVPRLVAQFFKAKPDVNIDLYITSADNVVELAIAQKIDLGITSILVDHPAVTAEPLCTARAVCVMPNDHPLAAKSVLTPRDLQGERFISFMQGSRIRHAIDTIFERRNIGRKTTAQSFTSHSACSLVSNGFGVSIVDPFTAWEYAQRGVLLVRPFRPAVTYHFHMLFPRFRHRSLLTNEFSRQLALTIRAPDFD